jgi:DNA-binding NarL/FixJ family response regulator
MTTLLCERSATTCVIADHHPAIVFALSRYLWRQGYAVVKTATDGEAALAAVERCRPSVCVADVHMPGLDGLELARRAARSSPTSSLLLYADAVEKGIVSDALDAGVRGLAVKDAPLEDLVRAIDIVSSGGLYVDPVIAASLAGVGARLGADAIRQKLSLRERDVLRLLSRGGSYGEIGSQLFLSPDTVRGYAAQAMSKLGARTRTQAVAVALREAMIA